MFHSSRTLRRFRRHSAVVGLGPGLRSKGWSTRLIMMSYDENASGTWRSGLAPIFSHEFPLDQEAQSVLDKLIGHPLDDTLANLDIEDIRSHPNTCLEGNDLGPVLNEKQDVIITATILPSEGTTPTEPDHASEKAFHSYDGPAAETDDLLKSNDALPAFVSPSSHEDGEGVSRVGNAPLLAHECLGNNEEETAMTSSVPSISLTALDGSYSRFVPGEPSIEKFPTDGKGIIDLIKMTERRLSEDMTSDDGNKVSSPPFMPTTPVENVFSPRSRSSSTGHSSRLDKIPEEFDLGEEMEMDTPDHVALDSGSKTPSKTPTEEFDAPLRSPVTDSVSGATLLGHETLLPPTDNAEATLHCHSPLLAHEAAGQEMQGEAEQFPSGSHSSAEDSKLIRAEHDTAGEVMTSKDVVPADEQKQPDHPSVED